jgi:uncharacterized C2H2 Zn-finger protein
MSFFTDLLEEYLKINFPINLQEISKIDKYINWYLADINNNYISAKSNDEQVIIELDIKSAFPTICNALYSDRKDFINYINNPNLEKKERLIYIVKNLNQEERKLLNIICKIIIMGVLFFDYDINSEIIILEIKKDGLIAIISYNDYNRINNLNNTNNNFINLLNKNNFIINIKKYKNYIRCNKTSWYIYDNFINIKGFYKYQPSFILEEGKNIIFNNSIKNINDLKNIYYNKQYSNLIFQNNLNSLIQKYFICDDKNRILNANRNYIEYKYGLIIDPFLYIQTFIFPLLLANISSKKN